MYYNHNLRTNLQEWKNRLQRANMDQFGNQVKYFLSNIENNKQLAGMLHEATQQFPYSQEQLKEIDEQKDAGARLSFTNETHHASYCITFTKYLLSQLEGTYDLQDFRMFLGRDFNETKNSIIEELFTPLVHYLHDKLDKSNSTIYLLEKYKRRTEWFTKSELLKKYQEATKSYEQILEDDLRMFLFDQGIDYPFSTPKSNSGRGDIIGAIDTSDPIVLEIKIIDKAKGYGKNRIKEGFTQVLKYANDYNKDVGYLVLFNLDNVEINFKFSETSKVFPPMFLFNNKTFFFIVIYLSMQKAASKLGTLNSIEIMEQDLIN